MDKSRGPSESASLTRYYEHDGILRAYANRAMFLAALFCILAFASLGFEIYARVQPPTVIRVDREGNATLVGGTGKANVTRELEILLAKQSANSDVTAEQTPAPTELEGKAVVRRFLDCYHSYTPDSASRNLAEALNMMTKNLRSLTMNKLRDDDTLGRIQQDHIISELRIRSIERTHAPWDFLAFGITEIHKVTDGAESTDRIVGQYNIRLAEQERNELNPSGLLVAEYSEKQMVGERDNNLEQKGELEK